MGVVLLLIALVTGVRMWASAIASDPDVALLLPMEGAQWIRMRTVEGPETRGALDFMAAFRTRFRVDSRPKRAILHVLAMRHVAVFLDGQVVVDGPWELDEWKVPLQVNLRPYLTPGEHELVLSVLNRTGPPVVLAHSDDLGITTGDGWEAKDYDRPEWEPAVTAGAPQTNTIGTRLPRVDQAFLSLLPLFAPIFLIVSAWSWLVTGRSGPVARLRRITPSASAIRWALLAATAVLANNNLAKLPYGIGYDVDGHLQYMIFIVRKWSIPFANQGWQMFQSPGYYLLSAPLYSLFYRVFSPGELTDALRIVPLLCGALQVQLCYLILREVHPDRGDLQAIGTVLGGLLSINLYMSQNLSNEPLVALFGSLVVLLAVRLLRDPGRWWSRRTFLLLGAVLGLALLTKVTAALLCGPLVLLVAYVARLRQASTSRALVDAAGALATIFAVAFLVCGWYYLRNWMELGVPFVGGWDESRGYIWWQEPGYRTIGQYLSFGSALVHPVYSAVQGFWDGFYSTLWLDGYTGSVVDYDMTPIWNFGFLLSSAWLGLLPSVALAVGSAATLLHPVRAAREGQLFALLCLATFVLAMLFLSLRLPSFSTVKASYTLSVLSCYAILGAAGFELLTRRRIARALVHGGMACWAVAAYASYFAV